jgi:hypothetical protein
VAFALSHGGDTDRLRDFDGDPRDRDREASPASESESTSRLGCEPTELPPLLLLRERECENGVVVVVVGIMLAAEERSSCGLRKLAKGDRFMTWEAERQC